MSVGDVMHVGVITCQPEASLRTVAGILAAHRIHAVVVESEDAEAGWAVVTDRDVVLAHSRGELDRLTARDAASAPTVTVGPDTELEHASVLMAHYDTCHAVVSEAAGGRPVGIVSSMDIASAVAAD